MLVDSNIIIYSLSDEYAHLREIFVSENTYLSEISRVEVLGYHKLTKRQLEYFSDIFNYAKIIIPTRQIFDTAIQLRQKYNLKLGDSIIAATALEYDLPLCTRNIKDFKRIEPLKCVNPIE